MKHLKCSSTARCIAVILTVLLGTAAIAGCIITLFTLDLQLYHKPLDTVVAEKSENLQIYYSARISHKINKVISENKITFENDASTINLIEETLWDELNRYLSNTNFQFGVIYDVTVDRDELSDKTHYIYQNFSTVVPYTMPYNDFCLTTFDNNYQTGGNMRLIKSLTHTYKKPVPDTTHLKKIWIVSTVRESLDLSDNDLFAQQKAFLTTLYNYRYVSLLVTIFLLAVTLALLIFCYCASGCQKGTAELQVTWRHRFPLILYLCCNPGIAVLCYILCISLLQDLIYGSTSVTFTCILCILLTAIGMLSFVFFLMNLSIRSRSGLFEKKLLSLRTRICTRIHGIFHLCTGHLSLFVKGGLVILGICFLEIMCIFSLQSSDFYFYIWFLIKFIEAIAALIILIQMKVLQDGSKTLASGNLKKKINTEYMLWEFKKHGKYLNQINDGMSIALEDCLKSEHFKTELITNVSHDIKTPLTSIINYVDLLQKENLTEEDKKEYLRILESQSGRLKKLIEDLIEASKASTGNLTINKESCNLQIFMTQIIGEFEEKLFSAKLESVIRKPEFPVLIQADSRYIWRIFENLISNIYKYAQPGTRVYIDLETDNNNARIIFRNTSKYALHLSGEDLTERFIRGDVSRNTEGNGLGLSIAKNLAEAMDGSLDIHVDGDLFKAIVTFPIF